MSTGMSTGMSTEMSTRIVTDTTVAVDAEILAVLDEHAAAHADRDADRLMSPYTDDAVRFTLAPPLQQTADTHYGTAQGLRQWLATFDGPVVIEYRHPVVVVSGDIAFAHCLTRMTATPVGAPASFSFWHRSTFGFRRIEGSWRIVHEHDSTPFLMDGSFRAATDLQP